MGEWRMNETLYTAEHIIKEVTDAIGTSHKALMEKSNQERRDNHPAGRQQQTRSVIPLGDQNN
jgi:hypothetical protein